VSHLRLGDAGKVMEQTFPPSCTVSVGLSICWQFARQDPPLDVLP
jgi:hypothetical protein